MLPNVAVVSGGRIKISVRDSGITVTITLMWPRTCTLTVWVLCVVSLLCCCLLVSCSYHAHAHTLTLFLFQQPQSSCLCFLWVFFVLCVNFLSVLCKVSLCKFTFVFASESYYLLFLVTACTAFLISQHQFLEWLDPIKQTRSRSRSR